MVGCDRWAMGGGKWAVGGCCRGIMQNGGHTPKTQLADIRWDTLYRCGEPDKIVAVATYPKANYLAANKIHFANVATELHELLIA